MPDKKIRKLMVNAGHLVIGILIIVVLILILQAGLGYVQINSTPPGWEIIRPPGEVSTLLIEGDTLWTGGKEGTIPVFHFLPGPLRQAMSGRYSGIIPALPGSVTIADS
jgi:hypothetical protein